jgi:hypothetical protein
MAGKFLIALTESRRSSAKVIPAAVLLSGCLGLLTACLEKTETQVVVDSGTAPSALVLSPAAVSLNPGDSVQFSLQNAVGEVFYLLADGNDGFLNPTSGVYSLPASVGSGIKSVVGIDSLGNRGSSAITLDGLETFSPPFAGSFYSYSSYRWTDGTLVTVGYLGGSGAIFYSIDGGATWTRSYSRRRRISGQRIP